MQSSIWHISNKQNVFVIVFPKFSLSTQLRRIPLKKKKKKLNYGEAKMKIREKWGLDGNCGVGYEKGGKREVNGKSVEETNNYYSF